MGRRSRVSRNVAAGLLVAGLFAGTFLWQSDDTWPLAQMRMFPGGSESAVAIMRIHGELASGRTEELDPFVFHLKRAEIEGQLDRVRANPAMLGDLVARYNRSARSDERIVRLVLTRQETVRRGGKTELVSRQVASWPG
jgi:hypothetical protein